MSDLHSREKSGEIREKKLANLPIRYSVSARISVDAHRKRLMAYKLGALKATKNI